MLSETLKEAIRRDTPFNIIIKTIYNSLQLTLGKVLFKYAQMKKRKKIIIFANLSYSGNPRAVFERFLERKDLMKKYDVYWMANDISTFLQLHKQRLPVLFKHGLLSVKIYKHADLWVLAHRGKMNLPPIMQDKYLQVRKIQLWHGVGPKGIDFTGAYDEFDAWCLSSDFIKKRHIELWNAPPEKLYVTGFARLDRLVRYLKYSPTTLKRLMGIPQKFDKVILYAPTFDIGLWPWGDPYEGISRLAQFLKEHNTYLLLRTHPYAKYDGKKLKKYLKKHENVKFVPMNEYPDTMLILAVSDILITDWSSIYTDYLVTRRPIIFIEVHREYFLKKRYRHTRSDVPSSFRPGIVVKKESDLYPALENVIVGRHAVDMNFYEMCLEKIHGMPNGNYSDRTISIIEKIMLGDGGK